MTKHHVDQIMHNKRFSGNTWLAKMRRTLTSLFKVHPSRQGECLRCGACCYLPKKCPFFQVSPDTGIGSCKVYSVRPPVCRKYPRTSKEQVVSPCGYQFSEE